jgi:hypothetical protein
LSAKAGTVCSQEMHAIEGLKPPTENSFVVNDIFTDFKRHDFGPNFYERNWDRTLPSAMGC